MGRCELHKTTGFATALLTAPATFCYAISSQHVNNNLPIIGDSLGIVSTTASWIINIELIIVIITATMTGKLGERFGTGSVMTCGCGIFAVFNLLYVIPQIESSFAGVLILRVGSSIGLGMLLPSSTPMATQLVVPGKLPVAVATISVMAPVGGIVSALAAGSIAQASSWRYMFVITGAIGVIYFIALAAKLPFKVPTRKAKIDFIGVLLLSVGLTCFIVGVVGLSDRFIEMWLCGVFIAVGLAVLCFFVYYNIKLSKNPIFAIELFNKSTMLCEFMLLFNNIIQYCERFYMPYVQMVLHGLSPTVSGFVMAIVGFGCIAFSPVSNIIYKKVATKYAVMLFITIYGAIILFNGFHIMYFFNLGLYATLNFIGIGIYVCMTVNVTNYNFSATPMKFAGTLGVMNQIMTNAGHSLGVSLAVVVNKFGLPKDYKGQVTNFSVQNVYIFAFCLAVLVLIASFAMGTFAFERGKLGFKEKNLQKTKTFEENLVGDVEMVVTENLEASAQLSKMEKLLTLFNGI